MYLMQRSVIFFFFLENVDFFPSCEQIEIFVISVFSGDFHIQGSGRESKHTFHTHVHALYTISDILADLRGSMATRGDRRRGSFRLLQPKDEEARSAVPAAEALTRTRYGGHTCLQTSTQESGICTSLSFPSSLPPLAARGMIYTSLRAAPQWGVAAAY